MALEKYIMEEFEKQPYEAFFIAGDYVDVLKEGEAILLPSSTATAVDNTGGDRTGEVLELSTMAIHEDTMLKVRCRAGEEDLSKYQITFRILTDAGNKWEIDCRMKIKER